MRRDMSAPGKHMSVLTRRDMSAPRHECAGKHTPPRPAPSLSPTRELRILRGSYKVLGRGRSARPALVIGRQAQGSSAWNPQVEVSRGSDLIPSLAWHLHNGGQLQGSRRCILRTSWRRRRGGGRRRGGLGRKERV